MKSMLFGLLFSAAILLACADEDAKKTESKEEGIKVLKIHFWKLLNQKVHSKFVKTKKLSWHNIESQIITI